ncbi:hypothetical protein, partial [Thiolapillus sp.]
LPTPFGEEPKNMKHARIVMTATLLVSMVSTLAGCVMLSGEERAPKERSQQGAGELSVERKLPAEMELSVEIELAGEREQAMESPPEETDGDVDLFCGFSDSGEGSIAYQTGFGVAALTRFRSESDAVRIAHALGHALAQRVYRLGADEVFSSALTSTCFERDFLIGYADIIGGTLAPLDAVRDAFVRGMRDGWLELKEQ